jgi:hypothetical protein
MHRKENVTTQARRISFPPEAIFQSAIQDGDNCELSLFLNAISQTGLDINQHNHLGITPLHQCVLNNNLDGVKMLINCGADLNMADKYGLTPLHTASACGFLQIASMLIVFGADIFSGANDGDLPVEFAKNTEMANLLQTEMVVQIHSREYVKSYIGYTCREWSIWIFRKCLYYLSQLLFYSIECIKQFLKRRQNSKPGNNNSDLPRDKTH